MHVESECFKCNYLNTMTHFSHSAIFHGDFSVLFASPESLLKEIDNVADNVYPGKVCCLPVDEAHSIIDWKTFRPIFSHLGEAKEIVASRAPWALFTATCDRQLKSALLKALGVTDVALVWAAPDRSIKPLHILLDEKSHN